MRWRGRYRDWALVEQESRRLRIPTSVDATYLELQSCQRGLLHQTDDRARGLSLCAARVVDSWGNHKAGQTGSAPRCEVLQQSPLHYFRGNTNQSSQTPCWRCHFSCHPGKNGDSSSVVGSQFLGRTPFWICSRSYSSRAGITTCSVCQVFYHPSAVFCIARLVAILTLYSIISLFPSLNTFKIRLGI
jgi:hypothetical protein